MGVGYRTTCPLGIVFRPSHMHKRILEVCFLGPSQSKMYQCARDRFRSDCVMIPAGAIDQDPGISPQAHIHVASKASWDKITDDLPQFDGDQQYSFLCAPGCVKTACIRSASSVSWGRYKALEEI